MRTRTVTVNEGEWFDDVPQSEWLGIARANGQALGAEHEARLAKLTSPGRWGVLCAHSSVVKEVYKVGLYDGWPYWQQRIAVSVRGTLGPETDWLDGVHGVHALVSCICEDGRHRMFCDGFRSAGRAA